MGGKRTGKRQRLYLCIACLTGLALAGCVRPCPPCPPVVAPAAPRQEERRAFRHLERVQGLVSQGDFEGALRESQEALARAPRGPHADELLFDQALLFAHFANPRKDYNKARGLFMRLVKEYPDSAFADEAAIWAGVLEAFEKAKQVDIEIEQKLKGLGK